MGDLANDHVGETQSEITALVGRAHDEPTRRQRLWRLSRHADQRLLIVVIDEWTSILRGFGVELLLDRLEDLSQQGRKYGVAMVLLAQSWSAGAVGSSQLRNPLPTSIVHRMRRDEARMLTGLPAEALPLDVHALEPGEAYIVGVDGPPARIRVPQLQLPPSVPPSRHLPEPDDLVRRKVAGRSPEAGREGDYEAQIVRLFQAGTSVADIVRAVFGVGPAGRAWQQSRAEVEAVIRRALGGQR